MGTLQCMVIMYRHAVIVLALVASAVANEQPWHTTPEIWQATPYTNSNGHPMPKYYHMSEADMKWGEALSYCEGVHIPGGWPARDSTLWCPTRPEEIDGILNLMYYKPMYSNESTAKAEDFMEGVWTGAFRMTADLDKNEVREGEWMCMAQDTGSSLYQPFEPRGVRWAPSAWGLNPRGRGWKQGECEPDCYRTYRSCIRAGVTFGIRSDHLDLEGDEWSEKVAAMQQSFCNASDRDEKRARAICVSQDQGLAAHAKSADMFDNKGLINDVKSKVLAARAVLVKSAMMKRIGGFALVAICFIAVLVFRKK